MQVHRRLTRTTSAEADSVSSGRQGQRKAYAHLYSIVTKVRRINTSSSLIEGWPEAVLPRVGISASIDARAVSRDEFAIQTRFRLHVAP
jgi:hypothetical protein